MPGTIKIPNLPAVTSFIDADLMVIHSGGVMSAITTANLRALMQLGTLAFVGLSFAGDAVVDGVSDRFQPTSTIKLVGVEASVQEAPIGSDLVIQLVDNSAAVVATITIGDGADFAHTTFGSPITLAANSTIRAKFTSVGSTTPGSWPSIRLSLQR